MKATTIRVKGFTAAEIDAVQQAAQQVWNDIGYDCLQATAEDKGKDINAVTMPRSQVIEVVIDAGRLEDQIRLNYIQSRDGQRLAADDLATAMLTARGLAVKFGALPYKTMQRMVRPAFRYTRYGL